jgi:hypothetical protein
MSDVPSEILNPKTLGRQDLYDQSIRWKKFKANAKFEEFANTEIWQEHQIIVIIVQKKRAVPMEQLFFDTRNSNRKQMRVYSIVDFLALNLQSFNQKINHVKTILHPLFGADNEILLFSRRTNYAGIGATVFFTAVMAFIASSYAFYCFRQCLPYYFWISMEFTHL